jgi:hypothetical protein
MKTGEFFDPRIKIKAPLRCDGIGRLDCAEDTESGARLAVRWLPLEANGEAAVKACAKLPEHPALPLIRQTGHMGDKAYVAMDFPDGRLLATMLGEPVSGELLLDIGAQLADALATIHSQRVYHGELSAESVLLAKGKAYLWDMPLVIANRLTDRRGEERLMHMLVRTAHFLPPERACGGGASAEGDVYSLAAVMCIAAGARLPQAQSTLGIVYKIANHEWAPEVPAMFREPYRSLLLRMLDTEPGVRPTAREVADLLAKPVAGIPTIPEMRAIPMPAFVIQKPVTAHVGAHPILKTSRPSPFASAPGALEPMLPSRSIADAAVKADAARPAPAAVVVKPDPTVRVIVPPVVLEAMSLGKEVPAIEPALKAMSAAAAATAQATATDPELKIPAEVQASSPMPAPAAAADPLSALLSGLGTASQPKPPAPEKKASTSGPRSQADVQRALVNTEPVLPPVPAPAVAEAHAPPPLPAPAPVQARRMSLEQVPMTDNVSVAKDLATAGAAALSEDEADALTVLPKAKPIGLIVVAALALTTTLIAVSVRALSHSKPAPAPLVVPAPKVAQPVKVAPPPVVQTVVDDDVLAPLPNNPAAKTRPAVRTRRAAAPRPAAAVPEQREPSASGDDFSLPADDAPDTLKRPSL